MVDRILGRTPKPVVEAPPAPTPTPAPSTEDRKAAVWARVQLARNLRRPRTNDLLAVMAD